MCIKNLTQFPELDRNFISRVERLLQGSSVEITGHEEWPGFITKLSAQGVKYLCVKNGGKEFCYETEEPAKGVYENFYDLKQEIAKLPEGEEADESFLRECIKPAIEGRHKSVIQDPDEEQAFQALGSRFESLGLLAPGHGEC